MTPFVILYVYGGIAGMGLAWLRGGHPERQGAMIWIANWTIARLLGDLDVGSLRAGAAIADLIALLAFLRLSLKHDRWWPFGVTACMALWMVLHGLEASSPGQSPVAVISAQLGPSLLGILFLGLGPVERWIAGERAVCDLESRWRGRRSGGV